MEEKVELVKRIRSDSAQNQNRMGSLQKIAGQENPYSINVTARQAANDELPIISFFTMFKVKFILCLCLFACFVAWDISGQKIKGIRPEQILNVLSKNITQEEIMSWIPK